MQGGLSAFPEGDFPLGDRGEFDGDLERSPFPLPLPLPLPFPFPFPLPLGDGYAASWDQGHDSPLEHDPFDAYCLHYPFFGAGDGALAGEAYLRED